MTRHKEWRYCVEFCVEINCEKYQRKMSRRFSQTLSFFCQFVCVFLGKKRWWEAQPKRKFGRWPLLQRRRPLVSNPLQTLALTLTSKKEQKKKKKDWMGNELHAQLYAAAFKNCVLTHVEQTYPYSIGERERVSESAETLQRQAIYCFSKKCSIFRCCCCCRCRRNGYLLHLSAVCVPSAASNTTNIFSSCFWLVVSCSWFGESRRRRPQWRRRRRQNRDLHSATFFSPSSSTLKVCSKNCSPFRFQEEVVVVDAETVETQQHSTTADLSRKEHQRTVKGYAEWSLAAAAAFRPSLQNITIIIINITNITPWLPICSHFFCY